MKRFPLISLALLVILLSLIGCKESPDVKPTVTVHDAHSTG